MPRLALAGRTIAFETHGKGPDVLFVHGPLWDSALWRPVVDRVSARCRCVTLDLRGCGRSTVTDAPWTWTGLLEDVRGVAKAAGVRHPVVVGHDSGGWIAARWGIESGDDLCAVVLLAPVLSLAAPARRRLAAIRDALRAGTFDAAGVDALMRQWLPDAWRKANRDWVEREAGRLIALDPDTQASLIDALLDAPGLVKGVDHVRCPAHACFGTEDKAAMNNEDIRADVSVMAVRLLPRVGHLLPVEAPDVVAEEILRAFEKDTEE